MSRSMPSFASVALVLFFIYVVSSSSLSSHTSINNVEPSSHPCELSDDLTLSNNDKVKRGPFESVQQMERVHMLEALLNKVTHSLRKGGVCFWAERDTLLAAHRHGATFPYAEHLDLAIMARSVDSAFKSLSLMNVENGEVDIEYEEASGRITVKHIKLGVVATVRINIYSVSSTERRLATPSFSFQPLVASVFPLKKAMFNGEIIPVPANSERYLMGQFGYNFDKSDKHFDWKTMSYVQNKKGEEDVYPLVSIIIPTYGRPAFLKKSIEFIKRQDYPNLEVVIVDDSPEANSQVIEGEDQTVFRYYHLSSRKSIGVKRNIAVEKSKGAIIVHWDDDDYFREHRVTQQVAPIIKGEVQMTVLEHHIYFHLPSKSFYHVRRASTWGPHFATFVFSRTIWDAGLRYPDNSMAEDYAFAEASLKAGFKIDVLNNEDGKHVYVRHRNTWEFELEDYASQVQKVDRPEFFSLKDESFFLSIETKSSSAPKPPRHFAAETIQWDRPELQPGWKTGIEQQGEGGVPPYYPHYPPYYPKYPHYNDDDDVFDATWIFVGVAAALPIALAVVLGGYFYYKSRQANGYTLLGEDGSLNSVA